MLHAFYPPSLYSPRAAMPFLNWLCFSRTVPQFSINLKPSYSILLHGLNLLHDTGITSKNVSWRSHPWASYFPACMLPSGPPSYLSLNWQYPKKQPYLLPGLFPKLLRCFVRSATSTTSKLGTMEFPTMPQVQLLKSLIINHFTYCGRPSLALCFAASLSSSSLSTSSQETAPK